MPALGPKTIIARVVDNWDTMGWRARVEVAMRKSHLALRFDFQFRVPTDVQVEPEFRVGTGPIMSFGTVIKIPYWEFLLPQSLGKKLTGADKFREN